MNKILRIPIIFSMLYAYSYAQASNASATNTPSPIAGIIAVIFFIALLFGTIMSLKGGLVIYYGKADLVLTCCVVAMLIASGITLANSNGLGIAGFIFSGFLLSISFVKSYRANKSLLKAMLAVPIKFVLVVFIILLALVAVTTAKSAAMNAMKATEAAGKGQKEEAAKATAEAVKHATAAAAATGGTLWLKKFISKLITEPPKVKS